MYGWGRHLACPAGTEDRSPVVTQRGGHGVGEHTQKLAPVTPADPPRLTDQGVGYEEDGVGSVPGIHRNHH